MIINHVTKERDRLYVIWNNFLARFFDDFWILNKCIKVLINWNKLDLNFERLTSGNITCKTWYREMFRCHQCVAGSLLVTAKFASTVYTWVYNESCADRLDICLLPRKKNLYPSLYKNANSHGRMADSFLYNRNGQSRAIVLTNQEIDFNYYSASRCWRQPDHLKYNLSVFQVNKKSLLYL